MDRKFKTLLLVFAALLASFGVYWLFSSGGAVPAESDGDGLAVSKSGDLSGGGETGIAAVRGSRRPQVVKEMEEKPSDGEESGEMDGEEEDQSKPTEEEKRADEEEALVDMFDALTDKWMEPADNGVVMEDVQKFVAQFQKIPQSRKGECLQRALNLVPDDNVMLLAGILMDKTQDAELLEMVYNDVLNRDEDVKKPILEQIFKDKTHPCWADTAWILDVTGEQPAAASADDANQPVIPKAE